MSYDVKLTTEAKTDIKRIVKYVFNKFDEVAALKAYNEIHAEIIKLATDPDKGYTIDELEQLGITKYRLLVLPPHNKVIYEKNDKKKTITIRIVFGSKQSFQQILLNRILSKAP